MFSHNGAVSVVARPPPSMPGNSRRLFLHPPTPYPQLRCCVALPRVGRLPVATPNHELSGCRSRLQDLSRLPSLRNAPRTCHGSHEGDEGLLGLRDALGSSGHVLKDAVNPSAVSQRDHVSPALPLTSLRILC